MRHEALMQLPSYKEDVAESQHDANIDNNDLDDNMQLTWEAINMLYAEIAALKQGITMSNQSGEIVTVSPMADTNVTVISKITEQDIGWTRSNVLQLRQIKGKNLFDFTEAFGGVGTVVEKDGLTATINDNGTVTIKGTSTADGWNTVLRFTASSSDNVHLRWIYPAGTYTVSKGMTVNCASVDGEWKSLTGNVSGTFTVGEPFWIQTTYITFKAGAEVDETIPLIMVSGTSLPSGGYVFEGNVYIAEFTQSISDGEFNWLTGELKDEEGNLVEVVTPFAAFAALDGTNTYMTGVGESTVTYQPKNSDSGSQGTVEAFDPEVWGMPVLYLDGNVTGMSKDDAVTLDYVYGTREGTCTVKWQGSSSLSYEKKNYTIKFDTAFEANEGWGEEKKYCIKANYIDYSHARNLGNAMLWGQIVKSRDNVPDELSTLVNGGAVDGFPILIVMNGEFLGLYTFNIPKDGWMMGMGSGNYEAILCAGNACPANGFRETATLDGDNDLEIEYITDENDTEWAVTSINNLISACQNTDGTDLDTTIAEMLDWQSAIDYYIFTVLIAGHDMTLKNYLLVTYDGVKWHFSAYDMDCTYGLTWDGKTWLPADVNPTFTFFAKQHRVMELITLYKKDELKARYAELRNSVLSETNIATVFANFAGQIPKVVYLQDAKMWPLIPNTSTNDIDQIRDYYHMRLQFVDEWIEGL